MVAMTSDRRPKRRQAFPFFSKDDFAGLPSSRQFRPYKLFEAALDHAVGDQVRKDGAYAVDLWSALANIVWNGPGGLSVTYGFRHASEIVAWVREDNSAVQWLNAGPPGVVAPWIESAMADLGWAWSIAD
jgi:hypothetical protein